MVVKYEVYGDRYTFSNKDGCLFLEHFNRCTYDYKTYSLPIYEYDKSGLNPWDTYVSLWNENGFYVTGGVNGLLEHIEKEINESRVWNTKAITTQTLINRMTNKDIF